MTANRPERFEGVVLISDSSHQDLNGRQLVTYNTHREQFTTWLSRKGNDPEALRGYTNDTARNYATISDRFFRFVWDQQGFTTNVSHDNADQYLRAQTLSDKGSNLRSKKYRPNLIILIYISRSAY